jgi:hypothetical protein
MYILSKMVSGSSGHLHDNANIDFLATLQQINSNGNKYYTSARDGVIPGHRRRYAHQWLG